MQRKGFTLLEVLTVVMIISILTAIAMPQYRKSLDRAKATEAMQMLPAIFEARERWMIEHGCRWDNSGVGYTCQDAGAGAVSFGKLDIEAKGTLNNDGTLSTPYFKYTLLGGKAHNNQQTVQAEPLWGESRELTETILYFQGDKIWCDYAGGSYSAFRPCERLGIEGRGQN